MINALDSTDRVDSVFGLIDSFTTRLRYGTGWVVCVVGVWPSQYGTGSWYVSHCWPFYANSFRRSVLPETSDAVGVPLCWCASAILTRRLRNTVLNSSRSVVERLGVRSNASSASWIIYALIADVVFPDSIWSSNVSAWACVPSVPNTHRFVSRIFTILSGRTVAWQCLRVLLRLHPRRLLDQHRQLPGGL